MQKPQIQRKPPYPIESVDNALRLLQILRDEGALRLSDAATALDVAPSTAHRLLAMLVYRGFAFQDANRVYLPGNSLGVGPVRVPWTRDLRDLAQPHLELLSSRLNETVNLMIRAGTKVRFLACVESSNILRVGDRQGAVLPASQASGGKVLLAELDPTLLAKMFLSRSSRMSGDGLDEPGFARLVAELDQVRARGYAVNDEDTEPGVGAVGMSLTGAGKRSIAAISVAAPTPRLAGIMSDEAIALLRTTRLEVEADLLEHGIDAEAATNNKV